MGRRDYRHRESKKPKKNAKKALPTTEILAPPMVEVAPKKRKEVLPSEPELKEAGQ